MTSLLSHFYFLQILVFIWKKHPTDKRYSFVLMNKITHTDTDTLINQVILTLTDFQGHRSRSNLIESKQMVKIRTITTHRLQTCYQGTPL